MRNNVKDAAQLSTNNNDGAALLRIIASSRLRTIHHNLEAALTATGVNDASGETNASAARASAKSRGRD